MSAHFLRGIFVRQQQRCFSVTIPTFKGHSKWQNIKAIKGKNDTIRSQKISALLKKARRAVTKNGGFDLKLNPELANVQKEFRAQSLPMETFNNYLIKLKTKPDVIVNFELIGPSGCSFIVEAETSSVNRTRSEIQRQINKIGNFRLVNDLRKKFDEKLVATVSGGLQEGKTLSLEEIEEIAIELNCEEVYEIHEDESAASCFELRFDLQNEQKLEDEIKAKGLVLEDVKKRLIPHQKMPINDGDSVLIDKFYAAMQEIEEIQNVFDNVDQ